jgi:hypothetical protein
VNVVKVDLAVSRSLNKVCPETLGEYRLAGSHVARDEDALACGEGAVEREAEELGEKTHLLVAVGKLTGYVFQ